MSRNINQTLLESLFWNPKPLPRKERIYLILRDRIFPGPELYIEFLSIHEAYEKIELAKDILQRLCFEANFPPPFSLFTNLINCERDSANRSGSPGYLPQDHLVHIVNTYLLGIYVFFYHPTFNRDLSNCFKNRRVDENYDPMLNSTKDFVSSWKYFCLFHDIAYPIESLLKGPSAQGKESLPYTGIYNHIPKHLKAEWSAEAISRLVLIWELLHDSKNVELQSIFYRLDYEYRDANGQEFRYSPYQGYLGIDKVCSYEHLKLFLGFIPKEDIISVLFDAFSELPLGFHLILSGREHIFVISDTNLNLPKHKIELYLRREESLIEPE